METAKRATQTWDSSEGPDSHSPPVPTLVRFFRADEPLDSVEAFELPSRAVWTVGRVNGWRATAPPGLIWSLNDAHMSNQHASLAQTATGWRLTDMGSKNGTFANGARVSEAHLLRDGDVVQCGFSFFIYREGLPRRDVDRLAVAKALELAPLDYQVEALLPFATSDLSLHLQGETGSGKEVVAHAIHALSGRRGAFVAMNCAAIPDNLFESELFGFEKGAFSGAVAPHRGQVIAARGGTLFLDEIAELSLPMQAKLLRVLELKEVLPLGAAKPTPVDFRLVSATLGDLKAMVADGRFRQDLYSRLGRTFRVPPLREHKEHLGRLIRSLLVARSRAGAPPTAVRFKLDAARALVEHSWPLNIREVKQCIEGALSAAAAGNSNEGSLVIELRHLPPSLVEPRPLDAPPTAESAVRKGRPTDAAVIAALRAAGGDRADAAKVLGISERTIYRRLERLREGGETVGDARANAGAFRNGESQ